MEYAIFKIHTRMIHTSYGDLKVYIHIFLNLESFAYQIFNALQYEKMACLKQQYNNVMSNNMGY